MLEIEGLLRPRDKFISDLGAPIKVAVSTVDAYAKFFPKHARSSGARILRNQNLRGNS